MKFILALNLLLFSISSIGQTYTENSHWLTTKGNIAKDWHWSGVDDARAAHDVLANAVLTGWPSNRILNYATRIYNCHGYGHANGHAWFQNDALERFMLDDYYQFTPSKLIPGDIIVYSDGIQLTHSAIVKSTDGGVHATEAWSKWGMWPLVAHSELDVHSVYGGIQFYLRKRGPFLSEDDKQLEIANIEILLDEVLKQDSKFLVGLANFDNTVISHIKKIPGFKKLLLSGKIGAELMLNRLKVETDTEYSAILIQALVEIGYKEAMPEIARRVSILETNHKKLTDIVLISAFRKFTQPGLPELKTQAENYLK